MLGEFRNEPVSTMSLPAVDDAPFEPLSRSYLHQQRAIWLGVFGLIAAAGMAAVVVGDAPRSIAWLPVIPVIGAVLAWVLEGLAFDHRGVQLRDRDVSSRRGLISRTTSTAPFVRVQHVTVDRGPLDRLFGIATVAVFTAGATSADVRVPGLEPDRAEELRELLVSKSAAMQVVAADESPST